MTAPRRVLAALLAALALLVVTAGPASAHAALLQTTPQDGELLPGRPGTVALLFNEPVGTGLGSVRVLDPAGERADTGVVRRVEDGTRLEVDLADGQVRGTYVLVWRVVSADSHPVSGASTFSVGERTEPAAAAEAGGSSRAALTAARATGYVGLLMVLGVLAVVLLVWPDARRSRAVRRTAVAGLLLTTAGTAAGLLLQGPYAAGLPVTRALDGTVLGEVLASTYGTAHVVRLMLLAALAAYLVGLLRREALPGRSEPALAVLLVLPLVVTWPLAGHAGAGDAVVLALPADALHLLAVGAWTGGLVVLLAGLVLRRPDPAALAAALPRWSRLATVAVGVMVATGLYATWREVGGLAALTGTTYGRLLLLKTVLVAFLLMLGLGGRAWVQRHYGTRPGARPGTRPGTGAPRRNPVQPATVAHAATEAQLLADEAAQHDPPAEPVPPGPAEVAQLRRSVLAEAVLALVVVLVTSVLVDTAPARTAYAEPLSTVRDLDATSRVQLDLDSAVVGVNTLHVYLTGPGGKAFDVPEVTARLSRPDGESLSLAVPRLGLGHYETRSLAVPYRGTWRLDVLVRTTDVTVRTTTLTTTFR